MPALLTHSIRMTIAVGLVASLAPWATRAESSSGFPYVAYVAEPDTYIRSGPSRDHYPTGQLPAGFAVEVYRHDADGWCAIRPPEGSFSVAPAHQLRMIDHRRAEVATDNVVTRVGSSLGQQRNAVQVLLSRGELVQLVEPAKAGDPWIRITPPAGEFRWIAARRLSRVPPTEAGAPRSAGRFGWQSQLAPANASAPSSAGDSAQKPLPWPQQSEAAVGGDAFAHLTGGAAAASAAATTPAAAGDSLWQPKSVVPATHVAHPAADAAQSENDKMQVVPGSPAAINLAQHQQPAVAPAAAADPPAADAAAAAATSPRIRFEGLSARIPTDPRVTEMQLKLSQTVIQPPAAWQLAGLRQEAAALLAQEQSPEVREELRDLLDRVATFEGIQNRYATARSTPPPAAAAAAPILSPAAQAAAAQAAAGQATAPVAGRPSSDAGEVLARVRRDLGRDDSVTPTPGESPTVADAGQPTEALYDAVGTLKPVVSKRENAPRYALIDDHGDVVTFVTAAPDVNLQSFVGRRIGIRGSRGFMPEYRRAHVTASRITPLEEKLVR